MVSARRKAMTLVEMLIVIIIIGVLASMLMLAGLEATSRAEATKIITNMESLREGCVIYYFEQENWPSDLSDLDGEMNIQFSKEHWNENGYYINISSSSDLGSIIYDISSTGASLRRVLERIGNDSGLLYAASSSDIHGIENLQKYVHSSTSGYLVKIFKKSLKK